MNLRPSVLAGILALAACGGGAHSTLPSLPNATQPSPSSAPNGKARFVVTIPKTTTSAAKRPAYISPSTQSLTLQIFQGATIVVDETVGLTPTSTGCSSTLASTQCVLTLSLAPGSYTATINTYDQTGGAGNLLSSGQNIAFTIVAGEANTVALTLSAIPESYVVVTTSSLVTGTTATGFTIDGINQSPQGFIVEALDADGNTIVGAGSPTYALSVTSGAGWRVTNPAAATPNNFTASSPGTGVTATMKITASFSDNTCSDGIAVCSTTFTYANHAQTLFVAVCGNSSCSGTTGDEILMYAPPYTGTPTAITTDMSGPVAIGMDGNKNLWVADNGNDKVTALAPPYTGSALYNFTAVAKPDGIAFDAENDLFVTAQAGAVNEYALPSYASLVQEISTVSGGTVALAVPLGPAAVDGSNNLYVNTEEGISKLSPSQFTTTTANLNSFPTSGAGGCTKVNTGGTLYFVITLSASAAISAPPYSSFVTTDTSGPWDLTFDSKGDEFVADSLNDINEYNTSGTLLQTITTGNYAATQNLQCQYLTTDDADYLFSMNDGNNTITIYAPPYSGILTTLSGHGLSNLQGIFLSP